MSISRTNIHLAVFCFLAIVLAPQTFSYGQRVMEGPQDAPDKLRLYRIGDEKIRFIMQTVEGIDFELDYLTKAAKDIALAAHNTNKVSHAWDKKWYYYGVPEVSVRKKYLMLIAHNISKNEIGWVAICNEGRRWNVMNNEGVTITPWNGDTAQFVYQFNGRRVDVEVYNPQDGGWSTSDIFYRFSDQLDPTVRLRDEERYAY